MRLDVLRILMDDHQPLSAPQIMERFGEKVDRVTLYRTVNTLTSKRLLHRVRGDDQVWRYGIGHAADARHEHAHFVCDECGTVECLDDTPAPQPKAKSKGIRPGYKVDYSELLVHGTCRDCGK